MSQECWAKDIKQLTLCGIQVNTSQPIADFGFYKPLIHNKNTGQVWACIPRETDGQILLSIARSYNLADILMDGLMRQAYLGLTLCVIKRSFLAPEGREYDFFHSIGINSWLWWEFYQAWIGIVHEDQKPAILSACRQKLIRNLRLGIQTIPNDLPQFNLPQT